MVTRNESTIGMNNYLSILSLISFIFWSLFVVFIFMGEFIYAGVFGILAAFIFGWFASKKGRPETSSIKHFSFSLGLTLSGVVVYLVIYTSAKVIISAL